MRYGAIVGWGIGIYAVMALAWSALSVYGLTGTIVSRVTQLLVLIIVATIAGRSLRFHSWKDILPYSVLWALTAGLLDAFLNVPVAGWQMFADWNLWLGYTLVVIAPLLAPYTRPLPEAPMTS
jgi:hypothetical protein